VSITVKRFETSYLNQTLRTLVKRCLHIVREYLSTNCCSQCWELPSGDEGEVLKHTLYRPDLASSNYHLFSPPKDALRGSKFDIDQEMKGVVRAWLITQPNTRTAGTSFCNVTVIWTQNAMTPFFFSLASS
jgi:hypothetical protein